MAVNDLQAFREQVAPELNREYQLAPVIVETPGAASLKLRPLYYRDLLH